MVAAVAAESVKIEIRVSRPIIAFRTFLSYSESESQERSRSLMNLFRPAPHVARLPGDEVRKLYPRFRWQILESTFIGYATFYFVRNNLPVVSKEMGTALHYSKAEIGDILALTAI